MFFLPVFLSAKQKKSLVPGQRSRRRHHAADCVLQGMSSESEDCLVVETKIEPDKKWIESLDNKEVEYFKSNVIPVEDLEDQKVVCSACWKQGNHKKKVRHPFLLDCKLIHVGN